MTDRMLRFALSGCGGVADFYLPAFRFLEGAELVAAIDPDPNARAYVEARGVPRTFADLDQALAAVSFDALIIGSPPTAHAAQAERAASAGIHLLCEKPMAATVGDCLRIITAARTGGVKLQLAHMKRFMRGNQKVKAIIDAGLLGTLFMAECHWDCNVPQLVGTYREDSVTMGGSLQDHGPHAFDLVRWWTGADILSVSASIRSVHPRRPTEDAAVVALDHERGIMSYHHMTRISYGREHTQDTYRLYGTLGTLVVRNDHHFPTMSLVSPEIILYRSNAEAKRFETYHGWNTEDAFRQNYPFYNELVAFRDAIRNDTEPLVTGEDGLRAVETAVAAYVSSWKGIKIALPFRDNVDLAELFRDIKTRDHAAFGDCAVGEESRPGTLIAEPVFGSTPPRTGERWSDERHGQKGRAGYDGVAGRLV